MRSVAVTGLFVLAGALVLLTGALFNGYPLIYFDTGAYVDSGLRLYTPVDRPIFYGLFVRFTSLGYSLWLVAAAQSILVSFTLLYTFRVFWEPRSARRLALLAMAVVAIGTNVPWYAGQIAPDVFAAVLILTFVVLLLSRRLPFPARVAFAFLFLFSALVHFSHLLVASALAASLALAWWVARLKRRQTILVPRRLTLVGGLVGIAWLTLPASYYWFGQGFTLAPGGSVFYVSRLLETGILREYLREKCPAKAYRLCRYQTQLPANSTTFMWAPHSPVFLTGGWQANNAEYRRMVLDTLRSPRYLLMQATEGVEATLRQLARFSAGEGLIAHPPGSFVFEKLAAHFPHELDEYISSRQFGGTDCGGRLLPPGLNRPIAEPESGLGFTDRNRVEHTLVASSLLALLAFFLLGWHRRFERTIGLATLMILGSIVANAAATAPLGTVCDRYLGRVIWLLPLWAVIGVLRYAARAPRRVAISD